MPSNEVITRFDEPASATATNSLSSGDHATPNQSLSAALGFDNHSTPSFEIITRFPKPELDTATKRCSSGDQAKALQSLFEGLD